jgi:hypothetical protein
VEVGFDRLELGFDSHELGFDSLELSVGMQWWGSAASKWVVVGFDSLELGFDSLELGVGIERWGSTASNWFRHAEVGSSAWNWVWACRGEVRQPRTGCGHAEMGFDSLELGLSMQWWGSTVVWACRGGVRQPQTGCDHAEVKFDSL